jgi:N6-adenosine-specific RNA methylase IME4
MQELFEPLPEGQFSVVLADPPWLFKTRSAKGEGKSAQRHYDCLSIADICTLPVADVAAKDCALFMWCTWPTIFHAERVANAWGFKYSGLAWEWIKRNPRTGKYAFGGGYGTRKNLEPCLLFRRGAPRVMSRSERDFMYGPRREHSRKPDEQYERIERMYPGGAKLELFCREARPGYTAWGNQTDKFKAAA